MVAAVQRAAQRASAQVSPPPAVTSKHALKPTPKPKATGAKAKKTNATSTIEKSRKVLAPGESVPTPSEVPNYFEADAGHDAP